MTVDVKMSKMPDNLKGREVKCGWCSEVFMYDDVHHHVHFKGVAEIDYNPFTNKILPIDERGFPITQDPATKVAIYNQDQPDPPNNFLDGITSVSVAIIKCVESHRGLYDPKLKWGASSKMTTFDVIALNVNEALKLNKADKLTGQIVKTKWDNMRKGFSRALLNKNQYHYASELQFVKKYLRSANTEIDDEKESCKRNTYDYQSGVHGQSASKRIRINIGNTPSTSHKPVGSGDSCEDKTSSETRDFVKSSSSNETLTAVKEASSSFLFKSSQLQSLEDKVKSAAKATLKQAAEVISEETCGSLNKENWSNNSLTIREAMLTVPQDKLLSIVNGVLKIMQKYMKKDG